MKKALFDELTTSIREAGSIRRGEIQPSRTFEFTADDVRAIRERLHKSQSEFARMIGVTTPTLQNWEQGRRKPQGPARALLAVASREPQLVENVLATAARLTRVRTPGEPRRTALRAAKTPRSAAAHRRLRAQKRS